MTDYPLPAPGEITGWTTPPTDGGERLDGRSTVLLTADRLITGRRGDVPGTLDVVGDVPAVGPDFAYVSCGTWSLVGLELDAPVLTEASRAANFTNELGVDQTVRY